MEVVIFDQNHILLFPVTQEAGRGGGGPDKINGVCDLKYRCIILLSLVFYIVLCFIVPLQWE